MKKEQQSSEQIADDEIDLLELIRPVWNERKFILKIVLIFFLFGLFTAIFSQKEFTATSTFIPHTESNKTGNLGGLASLAGINLGGLGATSEIPPALYPKIVNSVKFKRALLQMPITTKERSRTTYSSFYDELYNPGPLSMVKKYTVGLPAIILNSIRNPRKLTIPDSSTSHWKLIRISEDEAKHFKRLNRQITVIPNDKEGTVELNFVMPQALMAAEMAKAAEELLQNEIIKYKLQNAREQLKFTEKKFEEKRITFLQKQKELANFRDRNQHISSAVTMNQLQSLEAEYNFAFNIYSEMAKQLEQTKLQVSKDTPVFSVINPVSIPTENSAPNRFLILFLFIVAGLTIAIGYVFIMQLLEGIKGNRKNKN